MKLNILVRFEDYFLSLSENFQEWSEQIMERVHLLVRGRVQGVAFRAYTQMEARKLNLSGYVRNLPDGRVEILAEGKKESVARLILWAHQGSPVSVVEEVIEKSSEATGEFSSFEITY